MNLTNLQTDVRFLASTDSVGFPDADLTRSINEWYKRVAGYVLEFCGDFDFDEEEATTDLVANRAEYSLPTDLVKIKRCEVAGTEAIETGEGIMRPFLFSDNVTLIHLEIPVGMSAPPHAHPRQGVMVCLRGELEVLSGDDRHHPGDFFCLRGIDLPDQGGRVGALDDLRVEEVRPELEVVDVLSGAGYLLSAVNPWK